MSEAQSNPPDPTSESIEMPHGYWIHDNGAHFYIPSNNENAPLIALSHYYTAMVSHDPETNDWVRETLPKYRHDTGKEVWRFWRLYATYLILRRGWHLVWQGLIQTNLEPKEISSLIRRTEDVVADLGWPQEAIVEYRHIEKEEGEGMDFAWGYFCDSAIQREVDGLEDFGGLTNTDED